MVTGLLPFSIVEKQVVKRQIRYTPITLSTLMRYKSRLAENVKQKISEFLPPIISLVFDGCRQDLAQ